MPEIRSKAVVVPAFLVLFAANGSISTYGSVVHQLELGLRRDFAWSFIHADVPYPIQSADALAHFDLMPDLKRHRLIDNVTKLSVKGQLAPAPVCSISAIDPTHPLAPLLSKYPQAINPARPGSSRAKGVFHYLQTNGGPIAQRARRLAPDKLSAAPSEADLFVNGGLKGSVDQRANNSANNETENHSNQNDTSPAQTDNNNLVSNNIVNNVTRALPNPQVTNGDCCTNESVVEPSQSVIVNKSLVSKHDNEVDPPINNEQIKTKKSKAKKSLINLKKQTTRFTTPNAQ
ncbi:hypothetical protein TKK_0001352 [Trichogramma kaykai]